MRRGKTKGGGGGGRLEEVEKKEEKKKALLSSQLRPPRPLSHDSPLPLPLREYLPSPPFAHLAFASGIAREKQRVHLLGIVTSWETHAPGKKVSEIVDELLLSAISRKNLTWGVYFCARLAVYTAADAAFLLTRKSYCSIYNQQSFNLYFQLHSSWWRATI